jgi:hypothetical protein
MLARRRLTNPGVVVELGLAKGHDAGRKGRRIADLRQGDLRGHAFCSS